MKFPLILLQSIVLLAGCCMVAWGQDSVHADPLTLRHPTEWHEAYVPPSMGILVYGNLPLDESADNVADQLRPFRAGVLAYYDAWQVALDLRPEATYLRFMPRTIGRDWYTAWVFETGWSSGRVLGVPDYYTGERPYYDISERRYGVGVAARSGASEYAGLRWLFDLTYGIRLSDYRSILDDEIMRSTSDGYFSLQAGLLLRLPFRDIVVNMGPSLEYGMGTVLYTGYYYTTPTSIFFRAGLQFEVAFNGNRPQYVRGAR